MKYYLFILSIFLLSGCADTRYYPVALDANYGRSVRQVTQAQYLNPEAAANPSTKNHTKLDGQAGQQVINGYRQGFNQNNSQQTGVSSVNISTVSASSGGGQ